jgi:Virulence factor Evf
MRKLTTRPTVELKSRENFSGQLEAAAEFFDDPAYPAVEPPSETNPYADKDGLIEFIVTTELVDNDEVMKTLVGQKKLLVGITSVVQDYVNRYAAVNGPEFKTDAVLWQSTLDKIPLMGPGTQTKNTYSRTVEGVKIAKEFIQFIMELVVSEGSSGLASFEKFLDKQGESLRVGVEENKDAYRSLSMGVTMEAFEVGGNINYAPKIRQYRVDFTRENYKFAFFCGSYEKIHISFEMMYSAGIFDYEALEDPEIKKGFDDWLRGRRKAAIEDSTTFFDGEIPVVPRDPVAKSA